MKFIAARELAVPAVANRYLSRNGWLSPLAGGQYDFDAAGRLQGTAISPFNRPRSLVRTAIGTAHFQIARPSTNEPATLVGAAAFPFCHGVHPHHASCGSRCDELVLHVFYSVRAARRILPGGS